MGQNQGFKRHCYGFLNFLILTGQQSQNTLCQDDPPSHWLELFLLLRTLLLFLLLFIK